MPKSVKLLSYQISFSFTIQCRSVSSEKTWESLIQALVKAFRLQEAEETILVFDNYSDNIKNFY